MLDVSLKLVISYLYIYKKLAVQNTPSVIFDIFLFVRSTDGGIERYHPYYNCYVYSGVSKF